MTRPPIPTPIYHITPVDNLADILSTGGLLAKGALDQADKRYTNIAHQTIQDRRAAIAVPCGPGETLHDYVPFYFGPRSPMLYSLSRGNVEGFSGNQEDIIHLVSSVQVVVEAECSFIFTDGHGIMELTDFFEEIRDLDKIDWELIDSRYWHDTPEDPDRKRRRQAEFLIYKRFPIELIQEIGVMNRMTQTRVQNVLRADGMTIPVLVQSKWYY